MLIYCDDRSLPLRVRLRRPLMGGLTDKVAFITGAARGLGRAYAVRLAREGADIIGADICADISTVDYPLSTWDDLNETAKLVEKEGRRMVAQKADVRDADALRRAVRAGVDEFGRLDIIIPNAGIVRLGDEQGADLAKVWQDVIDVNLTGVWSTIEAGLPTMIDGGRGGSIVITSSSAGLKGTSIPRTGPIAYTAAKRALVGLAEVYAKTLAEHWIRVNTVHPTGVATGMVMNETMARLVATEDPALQAMQNALPIDVLQPEDIANAVAWLVSDEAKYITGVALPLDAGFTIR